jgi:hypothetical protein
MLGSKTNLRLFAVTAILLAAVSARRNYPTFEIKMDANVTVEERYKEVAAMMT